MSADPAREAGGRGQSGAGPAGRADPAQGVGFVDGRYCPRTELGLPITDLGFSLGDMAYDAVHVRNGAFFRLTDHLDRFERSIAERQYREFPADRAGVAEVLTECVRRAGLRDAMVTMVATRGDPVGFTKDLRTCRSRFLAWSAPYYSIASERQRAEGMAVIISSVLRIPSRSIDPTVKNYNRLDFCAAVMEAYEQGCEHAIMLDEEGDVTEGRGWNLFAVFGGKVMTPESGVLEGVTRRTVVELCRETNLDIEIGRLPGNRLPEADEIFMTSSAGGIMPITRVDGRPIGGGSPGPVTARLGGLYWALHDDPAYTTAIDYA